MTLVWEDPPGGDARASRFGKEPSPLRQERDDFIKGLEQNQGRWARLWDLETKEEARKRANYITKKGFSFAVRESARGAFSVYGRFNGYPEPDPEEPQTPDTPPSEPVPSNGEAREPTFQ